MSRQQLPRFLEKAASVAWLEPEPRDRSHAVIAPVDQCLAGDAFDGSRRARRVGFAHRRLHQWL
jgi:hypothetical protein